MRTTASIVLALLAQAAAAQAPEEARIAGLLEVALSYGGDDIGIVTFVDGGQQAIETGNGLTVSGGIAQRIDDRFGIKYVAGYKVSFSAASNADIRKTVMPVEIIPYYGIGDHRVGLGLSHHLSPKVDWDWLAPETKFDDSTGITIEYSFKRFSFSYTDMTYESGTSKLDASHLSAKFGLAF